MRYDIVAFTGHRTYNNSHDELLGATILELYNKGARHFRVGMAEGFDLAAGSILTDMMQTLSDIVIEACIPWPSFDSRLSAQERSTYHKILQHATIVRYSDNAYHPAVFRHRNDMLIENASIVVAWWSGAKGGTEYTLKKARKLGIYTINLHPKEQLQLSFND
jgi:uncharacterized phage-like protein YoqJ